MEHLTIPKDYHSVLNLYDTQIAIKTVKDFFQNLLATRLNLYRVSAPLFVDEASGLNDNLNGIERPVNFDIKDQAGKTAEIVHSLAKWKRYALHKYGFSYDEGIYTDMNAIRRDEDTDNIHSLYVDQWDWELIIDKKERNKSKLKEIVRRKGLIGLNFYNAFLGEGNSQEMLIKHAEHILNLGGENVLAMGSDFDGCSINPEIRGIEKMGSLYECLEKHFGRKLTDKIFYENANTYLLNR